MMTNPDFFSVSAQAEEDFLCVFFRFFQEAGAIAMRSMWNAYDVTIKSDGSPVTSTDLEISGLANTIFDPYLLRSDTFFLDEEDKESIGIDPKKVLEHRYIWILDPIDGTRIFANHLPFFSISLGILKQGKPWIGGVYFPALGEFFYSDGEQSFFVRNAFTENSQKKVILPLSSVPSRQKYFFCTERFLKTFRLDFSPCKILASGSATADLCFPCVERACGSIFQAHVWDFAGAWSVFRSAGLQLWNFSTGKPILFLQASDFLFDEEIPWKLKDMHILATEENFLAMREKVKREEKIF
jgi:fructose-1,6-bisphosphatase/inositol monophosphatase family enzyme